MKIKLFFRFFVLSINCLSAKGRIRLFIFFILVGGLPGFSFAQVIVGGGSHSLIICTDSTGRSWGANYSGQLGNGTTTSTTTPVSVSTLTALTAVASGWEHSLALKNDSTVWAWGYNGYGQLGDSTNTNRSTPVKVKNITSIVSISLGHIHTHSLAAKSDGSAWAWGYNSTGKLGDNTTLSKNAPVQVHGLNNVGFLTGITSVAGGHDYSLALKNDGTAWAWGANSFGQLGDSSNTQRNTPVKVKVLTNAAAIAVGDWHAVALKNDGTVWTWGYNGAGRLGDNTTVSKNAPIQVHGLNDVGFLTGIIKIAAGETFCLALKNDGTVWAWGKNDVGQLGDNSTTDKYTPVQVTGQGGVGFLTGIVALGAGARHSLALKNDGTLWTWGDNSSGQLGDGTYTMRIFPVQVSGLCLLPTSTDENTEQVSLTVFPNPTSGAFQIQLAAGNWQLASSQKQEASIEIYNVLGERILKKPDIKLKTFNEINLSDHPKGIYFVKFYDGKNIHTEKIVIQ